MNLAFHLLFLAALLLDPLRSIQSTRSSEAAPVANAGQSSDDDSKALVGRWQTSVADAGAHYAIDLQLNADGTYTKTLKGVVGNSTYGGTHSGTWTSRGYLVRLSGDGNWPPYTHNLATFRKVN